MQVNAASLMIQSKVVHVLGCIVFISCCFLSLVTSPVAHSEQHRTASHSALRGGDASGCAAEMPRMDVRRLAG